jgi:hypothetical protein
MADNHAEGWYTDPFGRRDARWMSDGSPTKLVRDGEEESYDDPPDEEPSVVATKVEEVQAGDGSDLLRAGDPAGGESLNERLHEAAQFGATWGAHAPLPDLRGDDPQQANPAPTVS